MGGGMPLAVAVPTLERMLRERIHRTRQTSVLKNLHRSCHLTAAAERAEVRCIATLGKGAPLKPCGRNVAV